jgi:hypothetical protein
MGHAVFTSPQSRAEARSLAFGPTHMLSGARFGEPGNLLLAGHRTSWFLPLERIAQNDLIYISRFDSRRRAQYTIHSPEAFANPYGNKVTLSREFLEIAVLQGVITDTHFVKRDRMGRLLVFLARILQDGWAKRARAIAVEMSARSGRSFLLGAQEGRFVAARGDLFDGLDGSFAH